MGTQDTAQALTILGIICNGFFLFFEVFYAFVFPPILLLTFIGLFVGIILPMIAYNEIPKGNRGSAGPLLMFTGIISLLFIFVIGGVLLIVAGALAASWNPYQHPGTRSRQTRFHPLGPYHEYDGRSIWARQGYSVDSATTSTKKCVNCGVELRRIDQFCHECGTNVSWY
ncbi:MAG: zinc ribbon domain-containing protein [Candidatus Hermodarchaeia archaeon]|jgi:hypothetical protein